MKKLIAIAALALVWTTPALAQFRGEMWPRVYDASTELGRAMNICEQHRSNVTTMPAIPNYSQGWESCAQIRAEWQKSEEARRMQEQADQEKRDKDFVEQLKQSLGK